MVLSIPILTRHFGVSLRFFMCGNSMSKDVVTIPASPGKHSATVIFLHGLGDTGHGWAAAMDSIKQPHIKYICPTAAATPVTLNGGFRMPSWFDLYTLEIGGKEDTQGIKNAAVLIHSLLDEEIAAGVAPNRIVLGGFSQGGALAMYSALTTSKTLAGMVGLSTWLPLHTSFPQDQQGNAQTPLLQCHGTEDPLVKVRWGQTTAEFMKGTLGNSNVTFKTYDGMAHGSCNKEIADVMEFINTCLPA